MLKQRYCEWDGKLLTINPGEIPSSFKKRITCGKSCAQKWVMHKQSQNIHVTTRYCENCDGEIERSISPNGNPQPKSQYEKRITCCRKCDAENRRKKRMAGYKPIEYPEYMTDTERRFILQSTQASVKSTKSGHDRIKPADMREWMSKAVDNARHFMHMKKVKDLLRHPND